MIGVISDETKRLALRDGSMPSAAWERMAPAFGEFDTSGTPSPNHLQLDLPVHAGVMTAGALEGRM